MKLSDILLTEAGEDRTFGCVMIGADIPSWGEYVRQLVDGDDVHPEEGYEDNPHVTVLYGIHEDEVPARDVLDAVRGWKPLALAVDELSIFECDDYDVVKLALPSDPSLLELRSAMEAFPNTQTFPDYKPHVTVAYVRKGLGQKYAGKLSQPFEVLFDTAIYSWRENGEKAQEEIRLSESISSRLRDAVR